MNVERRKPIIAIGDEKRAMNNKITQYCRAAYFTTFLIRFGSHLLLYIVLVVFSICDSYILNTIYVRSTAFSR